MRFNTQTLKKDTVVIDQNNTAFVGTELSQSPFSITVADMKKEDKTDILYGCVNKDGEIKQGAYQKALFIASIVAVDGIIDEASEPLTLERGVRDIIWEYGNEKLRTQITDAIKNFSEVSEKKSEELETA